MVNYEEFSREQLIDKIRELEGIIEKANPEDTPTYYTSQKNNTACNHFQATYGTKILNALPDMLSVLDYQGNYIALVSSEETVHVGNSSADLIGKNIKELLPPDAYLCVKKNFDRTIARRIASSSYHSLYVHGELEHFENRFILLDNQNILCMCRNVTDSIKVQNELQMIKLAVDNSLDEIYAVTISGSLLFANKQFTHHYNLDGDITKYTIRDIYPEIDPERWNKHIQEIREEGGALKYSDSHKRADGKMVQQEISVHILKDNENKEIVWAFVRDISEKIEQQTKINELNSLMEIILNNVPAYLFVKDTGDDFRYLYWNKAFEQFSKIPASRAIGHTDAEIFPNKEDAEKFRNDDLHLMKTKQRVEFQEEYSALTGEKRIVNTIKSIVSLKGKSPLLIGISWDITDLKRTEQALIQAKLKAEESDKLKSAFLANMSHEIRTPLNAIVGFSKLLADAENPEEREQFYDIVDKNSDLLLQLINDILDLSKIEAGIIEFTYNPVNCNALCQNLYESHLARTPKNVHLIYEKPDDELTIASDSNRITQVISNLLTNAQKFTKEGEIRFGFRKEENNVHFYVKDTGMGIPKSHLKKIFNRFIKLNSFVQGTGLGLPICDTIIKNLGGKIWVESVENEGSEFHFTIPGTPINLPQAEQDPIIVIPTEKKENNGLKNILVAEDVDSNFLLLKALIGKEYSLRRATNGREAVEMFEAEQPDLIFMDIKMPEMDGLEATRLIRKQSSVIPIIALTAFAYESDKEMALNAGCTDFMTKPFSRIDLHKILKTYI